MEQETSLGNTICLIIKFLRHHFIKIFQLLIFQNFGMKSCHTIYRKSGCDCKMCHFYLTVKDDCHLFDLLVVSRVFCLDFENETTVDFFDDLVYTWKQSGEELDRPFLNCIYRILYYFY